MPKKRGRPAADVSADVEVVVESEDADNNEVHPNPTIEYDDEDDTHEHEVDDDDEHGIDDDDMQGEQIRIEQAEELDEEQQLVPQDDDDDHETSVIREFKVYPYKFCGTSKPKSAGPRIHNHNIVCHSVTNPGRAYNFNLSKRLPLKQKCAITGAEAYELWACSGCRALVRHMRSQGVRKTPYSPHIKMLTTDPPLLITDPDHPSQPHICTHADASLSVNVESHRLELILIDDLAEVAQHAKMNDEGVHFGTKRLHNRTSVSMYSEYGQRVEQLVGTECADLPIAIQQDVYNKLMMYDERLRRAILRRRRQMSEEREKEELGEIDVLGGGGLHGTSKFTDRFKPVKPTFNIPQIQLTSDTIKLAAPVPDFADTARLSSDLGDRRLVRQERKIRRESRQSANDLSHSTLLADSTSLNGSSSSAKVVGRSRGTTAAQLLAKRRSVTMTSTTTGRWSRTQTRSAGKRIKTEPRSQEVDVTSASGLHDDGSMLVVMQDEDDEHMDNAYANEEQVITTTTPPQKTRSGRVVRRKTFHDEEQEPNELVVEEAQDPFTHFGQYVAESLRSMMLRKDRFLAQTAIQQVLFEVQSGNEVVVSGRAKSKR